MICPTRVFNNRHYYCCMYNAVWHIRVRSAPKGDEGKTRATHVLVQRDGGRCMLEEHVGHADLELSQLGHLALDLPCYHMAPSRGARDGDRFLSPAGLTCHDLHTEICCNSRGELTSGSAMKC